MLHYIKGLLVCKLMGSAVIETGSIGFEVGIPSNSRLYMTEDGSPVTIYTYMNVREDDISLFGFDDEEGLNLFKNLITVNGVGAKAAMAILSALPASEVVKAIVCEDTEVLATAQGVGKKTAQRIVLELKDKFKDTGIVGEDNNILSNDISRPGGQSVKKKTMDALVALGYSKAESQNFISGISDEDLSVEEYIKLALKNI